MASPRSVKPATFLRQSPNSNITPRFCRAARYAQNMNGENELITVYRSADSNAETDATAVCDFLVSSGIEAGVFDFRAPGVVDGTFEVRVPAAKAADAEELVATLDQDDPGQPDTSHELDLVTITQLQGTTGEVEALAIKSLLDANGISAVIVGASTLPNLMFEVKVAHDEVSRAEAIITEAKSVGPAGAAEAERESESL